MTTRAAILLLLLLWGAGCRKEPSSAGAARPNLLLVTLDTLRADHCSVYGYGLPTTPRLERLAREGVRFDAAYAPMPSTGPSHASLFSSLHPLRHGVVANGYVLGPEHAVLAETLRSAGYRTAAVIGAYPLKSQFGYGRGFESYDEAFAREDASVLSTRWEGHPLDEPYDRRATAVTRRALEWLGRRQGPEPFLLWLHYFDPHSPYDPPEPFRSRFARAEAPASERARTAAAYDGEIAFADEQLGRVIDALDAAGLGETTLVVVTGDHGEGLNSHGIKEHGEEIYEEAVRVPLLLRWKGHLPAGRTIGAPVETLDIAPTAVELLRAGSLSRRMRARSLTRLLAEAPSEGTRSVLLQSEHRANPRVDTFGIRQGRWKYVERRDEQKILEAQVFDLLADPGERTNLMARQPAEAGRLAGELRAWRKTGGRAPVAPPKLSPEDREALRALGYVQ